MASVASQLIEEVTAHAQSDSLEDARQICADGTYFPNNLRIIQNWRAPCVLGSDVAFLVTSRVTGIVTCTLWKSPDSEA